MVEIVLERETIIEMVEIVLETDSHRDSSRETVRDGRDSGRDSHRDGRDSVRERQS